MRPRKFFWKLFLGNALLLTAALLTSVWFIAREFDHFYNDDLIRHLRAQAGVLRHEVADSFDASHADQLDSLVKGMVSADLGGLRITLVAADGTVLADSEADPAHMEPHDDRPEVIQALAEGWGQNTRWSDTVKRDMTYVALRLGPPDDPAGVVRVSMGTRSIGARTLAIRRLTWVIALVALATAALLALGLARLWAGPVSRITATARSLAQGDLSARVPVSGADEIALLAQCLNDMREHLAGQLRTSEHQKRTLESLVAQLREGVIVTDPDARLLLANPEARRLLQLEPPRPEGSFEGIPAHECIQPEELLEMLQPAEVSGRSTVATAGTTEQETALGEPIARAGEKKLRVETPSGAVSLLARACDISLPGFGRSDGAGEPTPRTGRLLVLTDVTELTQIIQMKADFAANASHELRTPLSAIRAAIETLGSMDLAAEADAARHFLEVVGRQSKRMGLMVADLLKLSRAETRADQFEPAPVKTREILEEAHAAVSEAIAAKRLHWELEVPPPCEVLRANPELLRMVLRNLLDNAIQYTEPEGHIRVTARTSDGSVAIEVADDGCGIPAEDQGRVWERFYQVERTKPGGRRGSGLGLSIVRHAVAAMGGTVGLESQPGQGTRVTVTLPQHSEEGS